MNESSIKGSLLKKARELAPSFIWLRIEDRFTSGIPDLTVAGKGYGSWWEVKYANPDFPTQGSQELMMLRLHGALGRAFYIIYCEEGAVDGVSHKHVRIVSPRSFGQWDTQAVKTFPGFDHTAVVKYIVEAHTHGG